MEAAVALVKALDSAGSSSSSSRRPAEAAPGPFQALRPAVEKALAAGLSVPPSVRAELTTRA
eukprot:15441005-Alexandrium_andersonii.AAC.1